MSGAGGSPTGRQRWRSDADRFLRGELGARQYGERVEVLRAALAEFASAPSLGGRRLVLTLAREVLGASTPTYAQLIASTLDCLAKASEPAP